MKKVSDILPEEEESLVIFKNRFDSVHGCGDERIDGQTQLLQHLPRLHLGRLVVKKRWLNFDNTLQVGGGCV